MARIPELGRRGGGWVALQFLLMALAVAVGLLGPAWPETSAPARWVAGAALAGAGGVIAVLSARALGPGLTPFPRPAGPAHFVERGPYRFVRHPIYLGGILFLAGFALVFSPWALAVTAVLGGLWALKASVEERFLGEHYVEYAAYCERTRYRLVPFVY